MRTRINKNAVVHLLRALRPNVSMLLCVLAGLVMGVIFDQLTLHSFVPDNARSSFRLMAEAWNTIQRYYVDRAAIEPKKLTYGSISGMVDALDDTGHSVFLSPEMVREARVTESGRLEGIGIEIQMKNQHVVVVAPIDGSPAQRAGLHSGDIITGVNDRDITGLPLDQVVASISGPVGSSVTLSIFDPKTRNLHNVTLVRAEIELQDVTWVRLPGTEVADVRIARFGDDAVKELRQALREIHEQRLRGLILDLRNNPGGVLKEAIAVSSEFLANGNVLLVKNAQGRVTPVPVATGGLATTIPMAVLINGGSASASEIVIGALHDARRATLIGETTFGTGTVLAKFSLSDGSALMLAVEEWLTPSGRSFWHKGITPDMTVALAPDVIPLVPARERGVTATALQSAGDKQLLRALKWLEEAIATENSNTNNNHISVTH